MSRKLPRSNSPKKIGLTGGIGSGKSVVAKIFQALEIPIFNSDLRARTILETNDQVRLDILNLFGRKAYSGKLPNRAFIASKVFGNEELRKKLNQIVHPAVGIAFDEWVQSNKASVYLIKEAAILFETGTYKVLDANILVTAPEQLRIERIRARDDMEDDEIIRRMKSQWTDNQKTKLADYVISNGSDDALIPQVLKIHSQLVQH